jgi:hypothetical protein
MFLKLIDSVLTLYTVVMMVILIKIMIHNKVILKHLFYLILFPIIGFIQLLDTQIFAYIMPKHSSYLSNYLVGAYMTTEYVCLQYFVLTNLSLSKPKSLSLSLVIPLALLFAQINEPLFIENESFIIVMTETAALIISSLFLMTKIILNDEVKRLIDHPEFLIASAIFLMFTYFMPFYAIRNFLLDKIDMYIKIQTLVIVFGYSIFYSIIIYAIKWKTKH